MEVGRHREVREVPSNNAAQPLPLLGNRHVPALLQLGFHFAKLCLQLLTVGAPNQQETLTLERALMCVKPRKLKVSPF